VTANISPPGEERRVGLVHREITLLVVLTILAVFVLLITRAVASANTAMRTNDAAAWFARGQQDLYSVQIDAAMTALRRATGRDRIIRSMSC
jgi:hypothetical protein